MDTKNVSVVIPCYNEEETLPVLFDKIEKVRILTDRDRYRLHFIFVNDGSRDKTLALLRDRYGNSDYATVVNREQNGGFGAAIKSGLLEANGDLTVTIDADTNYDQLEIPKILEQLTDDYDMVTASPLHPDGHWNFPLHRFVTSRGVAMLYKIALGKKRQNIYTYTSGFRVYRQKILPDIMPEANDFLATAELIINALLKGYRVKEYPCVVYDRMYGKSKLRTIPIALSHLRMILKLLLRKKT